MKKESLQNFILAGLLMGMSACLALLWNFRDKIAETSERLARIETKLEINESKSIAQRP